MKSCIVQTCLFTLVKSLGKLDPNKRLFHPLWSLANLALCLCLFFLELIYDHRCDLVKVQWHGEDGHQCFSGLDLQTEYFVLGNVSELALYSFNSF